ncbi:hypothetical protein BH23ACT11_BH23ACT11_20630 [soil metagenome]
MVAVSDRLEILFATIAAGGGHVATARAMTEAIERYFPGEFHLRVEDYMKGVGTTELDRRHKDSWRRALRYPVLARAGQRLIDAFPGPAIAAQRLLLRDFARAAARDLERRSPRLVVSNHGLITTGLAEAKRLYGLRIPVLTFATEPHNISAYWAEPRADYVVAPSEEVRRDLLRLGIPSGKLEVVGYPVRQSFLNPPSKKEARQRLVLQDRFTCLVTFGGEGVGGDQLRLVDTLLSSDASPQVVAVTGRNEALKADLGRIRAGHDRLKVEGFVEDMAPHLAASDLFVGKAGPASVYEALAVGRPALLTGYAGLNERAVLRFVVREGVGCHVKNRNDLLQATRRYAADPALSEDVAIRCRALGIEDATERLARYVVRYARRHGG